MAKKPDHDVEWVSLNAGAFFDDPDFPYWDSRLAGAFCCLILKLYTNRGKLSSDPKKLQRIAQWQGDGWETAWKTLSQKFLEKDNYIYHKRVCKELRKARKRRQDAVAAGHRSADVRQRRLNDRTNDRCNDPSTKGREGKVRKDKVNKDKHKAQEEEKKIAKPTWDKASKSFIIPQEKINEWTESYPRIVLEDEIKLGTQFIRDHPETKRPVARLTNWLKNAERYAIAAGKQPRRRYKQPDVVTPLGQPRHPGEPDEIPIEDIPF